MVGHMQAASVAAPTAKPADKVAMSLAAMTGPASDADEQPQSDASASSDGDGDDPQDGSEGSDDGDAEDDGPAGDAGSEDESLEAVGFGDAMNKILQQTLAENAQPILAKRTTARMREIQSEKQQTKTARLSAAEKRQLEEKDMVIPDHTTLVKDRQLRAIATKGVVALFNAIQKHQHQAGSKDEKDTKKVKEMSKDNFLGLLKASQKASQKSSQKMSAPASSSWAVVQDDYMMGAKLKDWDAAHGTEVGRVRAEDDDKEAAEAAAWRQVGDTMDSDNEEAGVKRRPAARGSRAGKRAKRS